MRPLQLFTVGDGWFVRRLQLLHGLETLEQARVRVVVRRIKPVLVRAREILVHQFDERRREKRLVSRVEATCESVCGQGSRVSCISASARRTRSRTLIQLTSLVLVPPGNRVHGQADQRVQRVHDQLIEEEPDDDRLLSHGHIIAEPERTEEDWVVDEQTEGGEGDEEVDLTDSHELAGVR